MGVFRGRRIVASAAGRGLSPHLVAQIRRDEHGVRKPQLRMIELGAGVGAAGLMSTSHLAQRPFRPPVEPDLSAADEGELPGVLRGRLAGVGQP